jgi:hypothetical protein
MIRSTRNNDLTGNSKGRSKCQFIPDSVGLVRLSDGGCGGYGDGLCRLWRCVILMGWGGWGGHVQEVVPIALHSSGTTSFDLSGFPLQ